MRYTVDIPVPYRIADLISLLDARMGKLENRSSRMLYQKLMTRIETVSNDPRYAFIFEKANIGGDTMAEILGSIFRQPHNGVPMTIFQLAGFPSEVVDAVVSVVARMAFDFGLWSDGASPLLAGMRGSASLYIGRQSCRLWPDATGDFAHRQGRPEIRRPSRLDHAAARRTRSTILSQCNTLFAMRMTNDRDQTLLSFGGFRHGGGSSLLPAVAEYRRGLRLR